MPALAALPVAVRCAWRSLLTWAARALPARLRLLFRRTALAASRADLRAARPAGPAPTCGSR
jgi:hypothetical protein